MRWLACATRQPIPLRSGRSASSGHQAPYKRSRVRDRCDSGAEDLIERQALYNLLTALDYLIQAQPTWDEEPTD